MSVSDSSKHLIQICQLLEERNMSFSFCLNKADLLVFCGMALLYQGLDLKQESKLFQDNEKVVNAVIKTIGRMKTSVAYNFRRVADLLIKVEEPQQSLPTPPGHSPDLSVRRSSQKGLPVSKPKKKSSSQSNQPHQFSLGRHSSVSEPDLVAQQEKLKRMVMPGMAQVPGTGEPEPHRSSARSSLDSARPNATLLLQRRDQRLSMSQATMMARLSPPQKPNLDYLALGNSLSQQSPPSPVHKTLPLPHAAVLPSGVPAQSFYNPGQSSQKPPTSGISASDWEAFLGPMEGGQSTLYDPMYYGPQLPLDTPVTPAVEGSWSPESLDLSTFNLGEFGNSNGSSLSEESLSSVSGGDDFTSLEFRDPFSVGQGTMMPNEGFVMDSVRRDSQFL